jgi:predicted DNA-binding ribbon-helix-helix protein
MVALPKYVKRRTKPNGRVFLYYEKFRGTPKAWPRVPLPADPFSAEFSLRIDQCGRLLAQQDGDKWSWQLVDISGRARDLCDPKSKDFWPEVDAADKMGRKLAMGQRKTFAALIDEYKDSDAYKSGSVRGARRVTTSTLRIFALQWVARTSPHSLRLTRRPPLMPTRAGLERPVISGRCSPG